MFHETHSFDLYYFIVLMTDSWQIENLQEGVIYLFTGGCNNLLSTVSGICFNGPSDFYKYKLETGSLHPDENQAVVVEHMQTLHDDLKPYQHKVPLAGFFAKVTS